MPSGRSLNNMKCKNEKIVYIPGDIMINIERSYYIYKSYSAFISILTKEFIDHKSKETEDLIEKYRTMYQNAYIEFNMYIDTIINDEFGKMIDNMQYAIDFNERKIIFRWN